MDGLIAIFPTGQALYIFLICLAIGTFVIFKYCLDKFDEPIAAPDDKVPWNFVMPSRLTSQRQYLTGFATYCCIIVLIFIIVSVPIGPAKFSFILQAITAALAGKDPPDISALSGSGLQIYPTFPIVVAFYIVGLSPNLPQYLDFELPVRKLAYRLAYIPKNMNFIFNYMRFSQFDLSDDKVKDAFAAAELRRPNINADDVNTILPVLNRAVVLYAKAGALAGDLTLQSADELVHRLDLEAFEQYRNEIRNVGVNLQGINSRLDDVAELDASDRQRAIRTIQHDLTNNLTVLYVIFASSSTVKDIGRISDRLRAIGFSSAFPPRSAIPWDPIIRVVSAAAVVLFIAYEIAAHTWLGSNITNNVPPTIPGILKLLVIVLFIHAFAIGQALNLRASMIASDRYFSETGKGTAIAYAKIFGKSWILSLVCYLFLNFSQLFAVLLGPRPSDSGPSWAAMAILFYVEYYMIWALVPAICGYMTAYTVDSRSETAIDRTISGIVQGLAMGLFAVVAVEWNQGEASSFAIDAFNLVVYGGLGSVVGFLLPAALRRYWRALETQLPDQINLLRANVLQYFHDVQQFNEWLNMSNAGLNKHRPIDVLAEDDGLSRLTSFVSRTRQKAPAA
jgi:hypothetical protein